ncbi:RbsD/FucU family protein [Pararhizobium sp.]|uniref:RbsD/FucU family protein n=1 Tax=Pararhizobium sp. TaxID=1977563 RepID=UPI00271CAACA|nr:RbsD/FucU domain-containing protein [Pararhizobium sp.]MDO9418134.1 RbsD/FucU domain-containing protein [Pararhizobium sp.]
MLKNLNPLLTGDLLGILADMGHGDEIALVDANFPAAALAQRLIELPGQPVTDVLDAVLSIFPLDDFVDQPAGVMNAPDERPAIFAEFEESIVKGEGRPLDLELIGRFEFYDRAEAAYAIIATGERRLYGNIILKKGVVRL